MNARFTPVEERKSTVVFMKSRKPFGAPTPLHDPLKRVFAERCIRRLGLLIVVGLLIAGCSPSPTSPSTSGNTSARPARSFAGLVDIGGGRKMYLECRGSGSPTVVLVSGLDSAADVWTSYQTNPALAVFSEVSEFTRVCAYDRPGTPVGDNLTPSRSDPVPQPTTAQDAVRDLHALLRAVDEPGPYVLVGHSYGGLITRLYAGEYPSDVAGIVFVDAFAPEWQTALTPEQWQIAKAITGPSKDQLIQYPAMERIDMDASVTQVRAAAPPRRSLPVVVLSRDTATNPMGPSSRPWSRKASCPPSFRRTSATSTTVRGTRRRTLSRGLCRTHSTSSSSAAATTYRSTILRL